MENEKVQIYHQLKGLYDELLKMDDDGIEEVVQELNAMNFKGILDYYVELDKNGNNNFDDMDLMTCRKIIEILQYVYNNTPITSPVSDDDYDKLYQVIINRGIGDIVGAVNAQGKPLREHEYPDLRGTLDKVHFMYNMDKKGDNRRSVEDWVNTIESILGREMDDSELFDIWLQPKWDGVSVVFECDTDGFIEHALLRGDTDKNLAVDVTALFINYNFCEYAVRNKRFGVKTEVLMNNEAYKRICEEYKSFTSPRSATTGIVNEKNLKPELAKYLTIEVLRIQYQGEDSQILVNENYDISCNLYNMKEVQYFINEINERVREDGLSTDGVVMYLKDPRIQHKLGRRNDKINNFEVAYKFPAEEKKTVIIDVDFSIGLGSNVTPVAKIEPVVMKGKNIKSISLGSPERFESLDLHRGDEVIIKYEIIPYLDVTPACKKNPNGTKFELPTHCKYCGCKLEKDPTLKCVNDYCESRIIGNVVNYINKMRIENVNIETISTFFDQGIIRGIESLYELEKHKSLIVNLPGFGERSYQKIIDGINAKHTVFDYELMGSIGIPNIGERMFKKVLLLFDLNTLIRLSKEHMLLPNLIGLPGFGEKTAVKIQKGINSKIKTIEFLLNRLNIKDNINVTNIKGKVCFTKVRDEDFENRLISKGYEVSDSLTKETTHLIVPSLSVSSNKVDKAHKYGIPVLTLDEAIRTL